MRIVPHAAPQTIMLSSLYSAWVDQYLASPIPPETKAPCDDCAMLPPPGSQSSPNIYFHPKTKCCTFEPQLVNYRAGLILSDDDPALAAGRLTVEKRLRARIAVTPWGIEHSSRFLLLYGRTPGAFGRAPDLGCPHQIDGGCGIWSHRPATCTTWFCKHNRGATGHEFWSDLAELLREVDRQLALWCALELGAEAGLLLSTSSESLQLDAAELGAPIQEDLYRKHWGRWVGREAEFYRACAELVRPLEWNDVTRICGPRVTALARRVRARYEKLTTEPPTDRLRMGLIQIEGMAARKLRVVTYSAYDPLRMPPELAAALPHFDGRPSGEVLEEIRVERNLRLSSALVQRLADFRILVEDQQP